MVKRNIIILSALLVVSTIGVSALLVISKRSEYPGGGFTRKISTDIRCEVLDTLDLIYDSYYVAGKTTHGIYMGNLVSPFNVLRISLPDRKITRIQLTRPDLDSVRLQSLVISIDSPRYYISDGTEPYVFTGSLNDKFLNRLDIDGKYFIQFKPLNSSSAIVRSVWKDHGTRLGKIDFQGKVKFSKELLVRQNDGVFCTDGAIHKMNETQALYIYLYRNEYFITDTALQVVARGRTIDTTTVAKVKTSDFSDEKRSYRGSLPYVNRKSTLFGNILYINSSVVSDNEDRKAFRKASVIDMYDINLQQYQGSLSIPRFMGLGIEEMVVVDKFLVAFYQRHVVCYKIEESLTKT